MTPTPTWSSHAERSRSKPALERVTRRLQSAGEGVQVRICRDLVGRCRELNQVIAKLHEQIVSACTTWLQRCYRSRDVGH